MSGPGSPAEGGAPTPDPEPRSGRKLWWVLAATAIVVAIAATAGVFVVRIFPEGQRSKPPTKALPPATTVTDPIFGWTISFPGNWRRFDQRNTGNIRLTAAGGRGESFAGLQVLAAALPGTVSEKELPTLKDSAVKRLREEMPDVEISSARVIKLHKIPAIHLVYTFQELEGLPLLHSRYYLFNGAKAEQIIFETSPRDFPKYSKTFDAIAASFRSTPRRLSPAPSPN